jgi:hypothetical protein
MNYNLEKVLFLPLSTSRNMGDMVSTIGGEQLDMKIFSPFPTHYP